MPLLRSEYLREAETWTRNATFREDLPKEGLLSGLLIEASALLDLCLELLWRGSIQTSCQGPLDLAHSLAA